MILKIALSLSLYHSHGGLGKGNVGVFMARAGVGKTACLVYLALDEIVRGNKVLHFGVEESVDKVRVWYDEITSNLAETFHLSDTSELRKKVENNLIIMSYLSHSFSADKMRSAIQTALNQGGNAAMRYHCLIHTTHIDRDMIWSIFSVLEKIGSF